MTDQLVNVDNFARAETDRMFDALGREAGGINRIVHHREPAALDHQTVIRMNRDTLYSFAIVDISEGATLTVPDAAGRYLSIMIVNEDHYINRVFHDPGEYDLTVAEFDTDYVAVAARILVDPNDPGDIAAVAAIQDRLAVSATSSRPFAMPEYDTTSLDATRAALLELAKGMHGVEHTFGRKSEVNPVHHLIGSAAGWGGLPEAEAYYIMASPGLPVGRYQLTVGDVPVDGFWSISVYNAKGFFEASETGAVSVNSVTADRNTDDTVTVTFGGTPTDPNNLAVMDGWNYAVRLYRPRGEILNGTWAFPTLTE